MFWGQRLQRGAPPKFLLGGGGRLPAGSLRVLGTRIKPSQLLADCTGTKTEATDKVPCSNSAQDDPLGRIWGYLSKQSSTGQKLVPGTGALRLFASHLSPPQHPAEGTKATLDPLVSRIEQKSGPNQLKGSLKMSPGGARSACPPFLRTDPQVPSSDTFKHLHIPDALWNLSAIASLFCKRGQAPGPYGAGFPRVSCRQTELT